MVDVALDERPARATIGGDAAAAILLTLFDEAEAATILGALTPEEAKRIGSAMLSVADASAMDVEAALDMFVEKSRATTGLGLDAEPRVRSVFTAALGSARAENILTEIAPPGSATTLAKLRWMRVESMAAALEGEHPQVGALILACLTPDLAAEALRGLDEAKQSDLIYRAASLGNVSADALAELEHVLDRYANIGKAGGTVKIGQPGDAAKIVTRLPKGIDQRVLTRLKERDTTLGQQIEDDMFVFDDLSALDAKSLSILVRAVDAELLTLALRGAETAMIDRMLGGLSVRAADTIRDAMLESGPAKRAEVEGAQRDVAALARRMAEAGELDLGRQGEDYV